jgi:phosphatidylserine decarboxylase
MLPVRWGWLTILVSGLVLAAATWLAAEFWLRLVVGVIALGLWVFTWAFFRNPERKPEGGPRDLISPADGVVVDIQRCDDLDFLGCSCYRIGIFLSVFDVHVNRAPVDGKVVWAEYRPGLFLDARHPTSSQANEANSIGIAVDDKVFPGLRLMVRQLSGLIARRIVCRAAVGDRLGRGELYGMIRFGSRTELWIPVDAPVEIRVAVGDRVWGGQSILASLERDQP